MITQMGSPGLGQTCDLGKATRELLADWTTEDWRGLRELAPPLEGWWEWRAPSWSSRCLRPEELPFSWRGP